MALNWRWIVQLELNNVRRAPIGVVGQPLRSNHADERRGRDSTRIERSARKRVIERQVVIAGGAGDASLYIAAHVESWISGILNIKDARAGADGPLRCRAPRNAEARSEIPVIRLNKPVSQTAVSRDADRRVEAGGSVLIEIATSDADITRMQVWLAAEAGRNPDVHQAAAFVGPGR